MRRIDIFGRPRSSVSGLPLEKGVVLVDRTQAKVALEESAARDTATDGFATAEVSDATDARPDAPAASGIDAVAAADAEGTDVETEGAAALESADAETEGAVAAAPESESTDAETATEAAPASAVAEEAPELTDEQKAAALIQTIDGNPALRVPCEMILNACLQQSFEEGALLDAVEQRLVTLDAMPVQALSSVVEMLVRDGGLTETLTVDGQVYAGTLEDAFNDQTIAEDAECLIYEDITEAGRQVLEAIRPEHRAADLLQSQPHHRRGFIATLKACNVEEGLTTKQLEAVLDDQGLLFRDGRTRPSHHLSQHVREFPEGRRGHPVGPRMDHHRSGQNDPRGNRGVASGTHTAALPTEQEKEPALQRRG